MSQKAKLIILLLVISVAIFVYLLLTARVETVKQVTTDYTADNQSSSTKIDLVKLESDYRAATMPLVQNYANILKQIETATTTTTEQIKGLSDQINQIKSHILDLKVPSDLKDVHLNLILSLSKLNSYLNNKNQSDLEEAINLLKKILDQNSWLKE
jgi:ribosomal protein S15P/S13E